MHNWHQRKLYRSEFYGFVNCEMIKQTTKEKGNEKWFLEKEFTFLSIKNTMYLKRENIYG